MTTTAPNSTVQRRLQKVLETPTDNAELLTALQNLSTFYGKNSLAARRNLRGQIEKRGIEINNEFLNIFMSVQESLNEVQENVTQMKACCDEMSNRLTMTHDISGKLIQQAEKLNEQRKLNETHKLIAEKFLSRFQLTEEETNALKAPEITASFFDALQRVHQIHNDCKVLLRTQHQRAGLEIIDTMSTHQESAYRRLSRWIRTECKRFEAPVPDITPLLRKSLHALRERPTLLKYCLGEIATTRCKAVVRAFLAALTQGGPNGMPRPIEIHAHDPLRYTGDMLAWIHQAVASESELMHSLIEGVPSKETGKVNVNSALTGSTTDDTAKNILEVMDTIFDGVCRPFKVRLTQVLATKPAIVIVFRLANVLDFYSRTIGKVIGAKAVLPGILNECKQETLKVFYDSLKDYTEKLQQSPPHPPSTLAPPHEIYESINRLTDIVSIFDSSLVPVDQREAEFKPVLAAIVDPLAQICTLSATKLRQSDMAVYMINCLSVMQNALALYDFAAARSDSLTEHIKAHMDTVVTGQATSILSHCGLAQKLGLISAATEPLSKVSGLDIKSLADTMKAFEQLLSDPSAMLTPQCDRILNAQLRSYARSSVSQMIYESYQIFYNSVTDPKNGYENAESIFLYKPDQVKTMVDAL